MFGYMTDLHTVDETVTETIEADGTVITENQYL